MANLLIRQRQIWDMAYSPICVTGEGGEDLRNWVESNGNFSCVLTGPTQVEADVVYQGLFFLYFFKKSPISPVICVHRAMCIC